jgi:Mg-chelatase subunit ChlD
MSSWTRGRFDGVGLTQSPPGPHLAALQARYGGTALLCIDVSGSMTGEPLHQAIAGADKFLTEAEKAHYRCGLVLWSNAVIRYVPPNTPLRKVRAILEAASAAGGTKLSPALRLGVEELSPLTGDRVLCVFSDGGISDRQEAAELARRLCATGVRIIVRGLGHNAATVLAELTCPEDEDTERLINKVTDIGSGIASMARGLSTRRRS